MSQLIKPPSDLDAERSLISSILLDREALIKAAEIIDADDFYDPSNKIIYSACLELFEQASAVDIVTVKSFLNKNDQLTKVGGTKYLSELVSILPLTTNVEYYAKIIREDALRRKVISTSSDLVGLVLDESRKIEDILNEIEKRIFAISQKSKSKAFVHIKNVLMESTERLEQAATDPEKIRGISTGFNGLNNILTGLHGGDLIIIAARPSVGKSSLMLEIARTIAVDIKKKVALFSLEMGQDQIADRLVSLQGRINLMDIRMGNPPKSYYDAINDLYEADIFIDDTPGLHISELRSKCRKLDLEYGVDAVFVDYLQLLRGSAKDNRALEVTEISQSLKNIARELKVPVIALAQLNRSVEARNDRRPQLSDLRESGSIEQDADIVMFIHREAMYNRDLEGADKEKAEIIIAKHRNGATGIVPLRFIAEQARYTDVEAG